MVLNPGASSKNFLIKEIKETVEPLSQTNIQKFWEKILRVLSIRIQHPDGDLVHQKCLMLSWRLIMALKMF